MKGKDLYQFVRFGGMNLKKQKGYSDKAYSFHAPPANRGFYAMPKVAQEFFLIGSLETTISKHFRVMRQKIISWNVFLLEQR